MSIDAALYMLQPTAILLTTEIYKIFYFVGLRRTRPYHPSASFALRSTLSFYLPSVLNAGATPCFFFAVARRVVHRRCNSLCGAKCVSDKSISVGREMRRFMYPLHFLKVRLDIRKFVKRLQGRSPRSALEQSINVFAVSTRRRWKSQLQFFLNGSTNTSFCRVKLLDFKVRDCLTIDNQLTNYMRK